MKIIITDLTRFANQDIVCIAGINPETFECIRPMPYISRETCKKLNISPGAIIEGTFTNCYCSPPHIEDRNHADLKFLGPCSSDQFKYLLEKTSFQSVEEGFSVVIESEQKYIPFDNPPDKSIITLALHPHLLHIVEDAYRPGELRVIFTDQAGKTFRYLSITDLGFFEYAKRHMVRHKIEELNNFIRSQKILFIRLGLSRLYQSPDGRKGFWLQANGIYTFPDYIKEIRCYYQEQ